MIARLPRAWQSFVKLTGLDYLPYLAWKHFADSASAATQHSDEERPLLGDLGDEEATKEALRYATSLLEREEQRLDSIERKAFTLLGTTGVATAFVVGFAGLILDRSKLGADLAFHCAAGLYLLIVVALLLTVGLAQRAVGVGRYKFSYPGLDEARRLAEVPLAQAQRERAETSLRCFTSNQRVVNNKANFLIGAQVWFRNAMIALLLLVFVLVGHALFGSQPSVEFLAPATVQATPIPTTANHRGGATQGLSAVMATGPGTAPAKRPPEATQHNSPAATARPAAARQ